MIGRRGGRGYLLGAQLNYAETEADKHVICSGTATLYFTDVSYMNFTDTLYFTDVLHIITIPKMNSSGCASLGRVFKRALMLTSRAGAFWCKPRSAAPQCVSSSSA